MKKTVKCRKKNQDRVLCRTRPSNPFNPWSECDLKSEATFQDLRQNYDFFKCPSSSKSLFDCEQLDDLSLSKKYYECDTPSNDNIPASMSTPFKNVGNSCFFNSAIKALMVIDPLVTALIRDSAILFEIILKQEILGTPFIDYYNLIKWKDDEGKYVELGANVIKNLSDHKHWLITYDFLALIDNLIFSDNMSIGERLPGICLPLGLYYSSTGNKKQEDAGEVMLAILESISEVYRQIRVTLSNPIDLIKYKSTKTIKYPDGTVNYQHPVNIPLEIKKIDYSFLEELIPLNAESKDEDTEMETSESYEVGQYLFISIPRTNYEKIDGEYKKSKNLTPVKYPLNFKLNILGNVQLTLSAVVWHHGSNTDSGHYTSWTKFGQIWYDNNDSIVSRIRVNGTYIEEDNSDNKRAIALIYRRVATGK